MGRVFGTLAFKLHEVLVACTKYGSGSVYSCMVCLGCICAGPICGTIVKAAPNPPPSTYRVNLLYTVGWPVGPCCCIDANQPWYCYPRCGVLPCMSWDANNFAHVTAFCCLPPTKTQMLARSNPAYHNAVNALKSSDAVALRRAIREDTAANCYTRRAMRRNHVNFGVRLVFSLTGDDVEHIEICTAPPLLGRTVKAEVGRLRTADSSGVSLFIMDKDGGVGQEEAVGDDELIRDGQTIFVIVEAARGGQSQESGFTPHQQWMERRYGNNQLPGWDEDGKDYVCGGDHCLMPDDRRSGCCGDRFCHVPCAACLPVLRWPDATYVYERSTRGESLIQLAQRLARDEPARADSPKWKLCMKELGLAPTIQ